MAELKNRATDGSVAAFLEGIEDPGRRADCDKVLGIMQEVIGESPKMWGASMVGFGSYHYRYDSGREGDWFLAGFSPRKQNLTIYVMAGFEPFEPLMAKLGKYKTGKSCLYVKRLDDIDTGVLKRLVRESVKEMKRRYGHSR